MAIALVVAEPFGGSRADDASVAQAQEVEETIEDAGDDVADWVLRLFRGVEDDAKEPPPGGKGGKGNAGGGTGQGGGSGSGGGGGGNDGGGDDGGGDDGGDD